MAAPQGRRNSQLSAVEDPAPDPPRSLKPHRSPTARRVSRGPSGGPRAPDLTRRHAEQGEAAWPTWGPTWCRASALGPLVLTSVTRTAAKGCWGEAARRARAREQGPGTPACSLQRAAHPRAPNSEMRLGASMVPAPLLSGLGVTERCAVTLASSLQVIWNPRLSRVFST